MRASMLISLALSLACGDPSTRTGTAAAPPAPNIITPPRPPTTIIPPERRCGEAGPAPTALPPALVTGLTSLATATLRPGEVHTNGAVTLRYTASPEPALIMDLAATEADGGPWSLQHPLAPKTAVRIHLASYRVDARADAGTPPARIELELSREVCPESHAFPADLVPASLWVSTDGIRTHTQDLPGGQLSLAITAPSEGPELEVRTPGYKHRLALRPGTPHNLRAGRSIVRVDEVVPGPGTRFADRWTSDTLPRAHARVTIESAPPPVLTRAGPAQTCGTPSPERTALPAELTADPVAAEEQLATLGAAVQLGPLPLAAHMPLAEKFDPPPVHRLERQGGPALRPDVMLWGAPEPAQWTRAGTDLIRIDAGPRPDTLRLRRFTLACPAEHPLTQPPTQPVYVWLSTRGLVEVTLGDSRSPTLVLGLTSNVDSPALSLMNARASVFEPIDPSIVGNVYTLDRWQIEIVDALFSGDTRPGRAERWQTTAPVPALHVQLRVSPA